MSLKIAAVKEFPKPQSVKEIWTFLFLVNFYKMHVHNMDTTCRPLTASTQRNLHGVLSVLTHSTKSSIR